MRRFFLYIAIFLLLYTINYAENLSKDKFFYSNFTNNYKNINLISLRKLEKFFPLINLTKEDAGIIHRFINAVGPITSEDKLNKLYGYDKRKIDILKKYFIFTKPAIDFKAEVIRKIYILYEIDNKKPKETNCEKGDKIDILAFDKLRLRLSDAGGIKAYLNGKKINLGKDGEIINKLIKLKTSNKKQNVIIIDWYSDRRDEKYKKK